MAKSLPNFDELVVHYPARLSAEEVKRQIGGDVNADHLKNTCVIRVSQALNYTNHPIPPDTPKFRTKYGSDKKWYGLRVDEFWDYLLKHYGKPTVYVRKGKANGNIIPIAKFSGTRGIIGFRAKFSDATGHFTLWDGASLLQGGEYDYFGNATEAGLWEAGTLRHLAAPY